MKPIAVAISDIHFTVSTLNTASRALRRAVREAETRLVPLVIAGDLHDSKAIIRAEVANELLTIFANARCRVYILVANHDLVNERGTEHGLNYLRSSNVDVIQSPVTVSLSGVPVRLIPYQASQEAMETALDTTHLVIMHQGVKGAWTGDYVHDRTAVDDHLFFNHTVFSGHYHRHQTIGNVTYIGSPYTITFGEASDPDKGFLVINSDGTFERVLTGLRKHVVLEPRILPEGQLIWDKKVDLQPDDLVWVKITGPRSLLDKLDKKTFGEHWLDRVDYKLDKIYVDTALETCRIEHMSEMEVFDMVVDKLEDTYAHKAALKEKARELLSAS